MESFLLTVFFCLKILKYAVPLWHFARMDLAGPALSLTCEFAGLSQGVHRHVRAHLGGKQTRAYRQLPLSHQPWCTPRSEDGLHGAEPLTLCGCIRRSGFEIARSIRGSVPPADGAQLAGRKGTSGRTSEAFSSTGPRS